MTIQTPYTGNKVNDSVFSNIYQILNWLQDAIKKVDKKRSDDTVNLTMAVNNTAMTVADTTSVDLTVTGQQISAETIGLTGTITFVE